MAGMVGQDLTGCGAARANGADEIARTARLLRGHVRRARAGRHFLDRSIGKTDANHQSSSILRKRHNARHSRAAAFSDFSRFFVGWKDVRCGTRSLGTPRRPSPGPPTRSAKPNGMCNAAPITIACTLTSNSRSSQNQGTIGQITPIAPLFLIEASGRVKPIGLAMRLTSQ